MRIVQSIWIATLVAASLLVGTPAVANASSSTPASADAKQKAKKFFSDGQAAYQTGDYAVALSLFEQAYAAFPAPALLFNLAQCHRKMNNAAAALETLERYKASDANMPAKTKQDVETQIEEARQIVEQERAEKEKQEAAAAAEREKAEAAARAKAEADAAAAAAAKSDQEGTADAPGPDPLVIGAVAGGVVLAAVTGTVVALALLAPAPTPPTTTLGTVDLR